MGRTGLGTAVLLALALLPSSADATEPYEGSWVTALQDCGNDDGPTSLTVIDLELELDGKPRAMVERYENHCLIEEKKTVGNDTTLSATCFEFWDDLKQNANSRSATIRLSLVSKDRLKIDGRQYRRCPAKPLRR